MPNIATITTIISIVTFFVTGILAVLAVLDKKRIADREEADKLDVRIISLLKEQVAGLEKKATTQEAQTKEMTAKLEALITENKILREVLQGRDEATLLFQKQGFETMKVIPQLFQMVTDTHSNIDKLIKLIEQHLKIIQQNIK